MLANIIRTRSSTKAILGVAAAVLAGLFALSATMSNLGGYYAMVVGLLLGAVLLSEGVVGHYLTSSGYKHLGGRDVLNIVSIVFGAAAIMQAVLFLPVISTFFPSVITAWFGRMSMVIGLGAGVLAVMHLFLKD